MAVRSPGSAEGERELLAAARRGDQRAFDLLLEPHRARLHAHCYRMLGSVHDAEDALQDTLLRAWRGLPGFEGRSSLRSWLYQIATNACLRLIERREPRFLPSERQPAARPHEAPGEPLAEPIWLEPYPDERHDLGDGIAEPEARYELRESVELAFIAALQHLPARQRAALILHDVLGFSAREVAGSLGTTVPAVNSALQRARRIVDERIPPPSQQATLRSLGDERQRQLVERFVAAFERVDIKAIVALLTEDVTWSMPPLPTWYQGLEGVTAFLSEVPLQERWRRVPARASGQLAVAGYIWNAAMQRFTANVLDVLTLRGDRIQAVTGFLSPDVFPSFGLVKELAS